MGRFWRSPNDYIARIAGNGNGGGDPQHRLVVIRGRPGRPQAGAHTLTFGGFNNKKTYNDESTEILIDNVTVSTQ